MAPTKVASPLDRFPLAPAVAIPRILASSCGDIGTGKTRFALTGPAPIVVFSTDDGTEGVVEEFRQENDKEIRVSKFDWTPSTDESPEALQELAIQLADRYCEELRIAIEFARTIVVDRETDIWNIFRYAEFGAPKADVPRDFDKVNARMRKYLQLPKKTAVNFIAISSVRDEWVSQNKKSGGTKRAGFGDTASLMNIELTHEREGNNFFTTIGKARGPGASAALGMRIGDLDIPTLGTMLFPDTDESDWS